LINRFDEPDEKLTEKPHRKTQRAQDLRRAWQLREDLADGLTS
jgi:hypothetical protein